MMLKEDGVKADGKCGAVPRNVTVSGPGGGCLLEAGHPGQHCTMVEYGVNINWSYLPVAEKNPAEFVLTGDGAFRVAEIIAVTKVAGQWTVCFRGGDRLAVTECIAMKLAERLISVLTGAS
jgi:hypothetical protein